MKIVIIGKGKVGQALKRGLSRAWSAQVSLQGKRPNVNALRGAEVVVIAVPDSEISGVAEEIASELKKRCTVLHCSGSRGIEDLEACRVRGMNVGVLHPMISFPTRRARPNFEDSVLVSSGESAAVKKAKHLAKLLRAQCIEVNATGPLYHAAAALAANGSAALAWYAVRILEQAGLKARDARLAIGRLLVSVGENIASVGVPEALSGPVVRGDLPTLHAHRQALSIVPKDLADAYHTSAKLIFECAKQTGLKKKQAKEVADWLH